MAPYREAHRRTGVGNFVADIPVDASHPEFSRSPASRERLRGLKVPSLMLWGPRDSVFSDRYLKDLITRFPHADVHRFEGAGRLAAEDREHAAPVFQWLAENVGAREDSSAEADAITPGGRPPDHAAEPEQTEFRPLWDLLGKQAAGLAGADTAVAEMAPDGTVARSLSWKQLDRNILDLAAGLREAGVDSRSRVSLMVPPGVDLTVALYACLRLGAVVVVADAGLGTKGLSRAVKGATPDFLIGVDKALAAASVLGWPGRRISVRELPAARRRMLGVEASLDALAYTGAGRGSSQPGDSVDPDAPAAVLFTSGSTGPAKGVLYAHRQLAAMRDTVAATFEIRPGARLVAGFAPFALLGPALGAVSVTPAMDVTAPRTLTACALAGAAAAIDATVVFASPAALRNVLATRDDLEEAGRKALDGIGLLLSAGAPVPEPLLAEVQRLLPRASLHTPYGMTEALPVTDITLEQIQAADGDAAAGAETGTGARRAGGGSRQWRLRGVAGAWRPGGRRAAGDRWHGARFLSVTEPGVTGEILVSAPHVKEAYDRLWLTQQESASLPGWHRTGDVGHFDGAGRLWVEGRLAHVVTAPGAVVTPVGAEQAIERLDAVRLAAITGVGPAGTQAVVAVVETVPAARKAGPAAPQLAGRVRRAALEAGVQVSAVLEVPAQPTDIRHNAKIDRSRLSRWATRVLAGGRLGKP